MGPVGRIRTEISRSRRLVSETVFQNLNSLYQYVVHDLDQKVSALGASGEIDARACANLGERFSREVSTKLDDALYQLARELKLTSTAAAT